MTPQALLQHSRFVRGVARGLLMDEGLADDVVQDTWLKALEKQPTDEGRLRGWLGRVASRLALRSLRGRRRREARERQAAQAEVVASSVETRQRAEFLETVTQTVLELREPYRTTVMLRYYEGLRFADIALRQMIERSLTQTRRQVEVGRSQPAQDFYIAFEAVAQLVQRLLLSGHAATQSSQTRRGQLIVGTPAPHEFFGFAMK